jgi:ribonuclease HII
MSYRRHPKQPLLFSEASLQLEPPALDEAFRKRGFRMLAGVDEAGRGPLAGPVVAAAVILPQACRIPGVTDSKAVPEEQRIGLWHAIRETAVSVGVGIVNAEEIDRINILRATLQAMETAVSRLRPSPEALLVDGPMGIGSSVPQFPIVKGDARSQSVAAASIVAKVIRDRIMARYHLFYPRYGFIRHKGYATAEHLEALQRHGCSPIHRKTFKGVKGINPGGSSPATTPAAEK